MGTERRRSEYRGTTRHVEAMGLANGVVGGIDDADREALAELMLAAYRGTIDDEGETIVEAREAIDEYLVRAIRDHSLVVAVGGAPVAFAFVARHDGVHYVDPVVVAPDRKRRGLGRAVVAQCLVSLRHAGIDEVGATITDGNEASERLFAGLGFTRRGPWPPDPTAAGRQRR